MRRRLLLERAAWQLSHTQLSVTDISLHANYGSLEAFARAFRKAFRVSPSLYRRMGATYNHLHATNGIHHHSGKDCTRGVGQFMDLFDIFSGQESWHTRRLLDLAKTLTDEQLDRPLNNQVKVFPWDSPGQSMRQILDRMVATKEVWAAALTGGSMPPMDSAPPADRTPSARGTQGCAQPQCLGRHVCRCAVRTAGDFCLWRHVRARDYIQFLQAHARNGRAATPGSQGGRFWLSQRVSREPCERVRPFRSRADSRSVRPASTNPRRIEPWGRLIASTPCGRLTR
jgi:helix-turn-helix protein